MTQRLFNPELIAPCGMNCGICKGYIAYIRGVPRQRGRVTHCAGCRSRAKNCYIKRNCKKMTNSQVQYCFECDAMLCENLNHLDTRYRECYGMSMVENLKMLKAEGMDGFLKNQEARHRCQPAATRFLCMMENAIHTGT